MKIIIALRRLFRGRPLPKALIPLLSSVVLVMLFSTILSNFFQVGLHDSGLVLEASAGILLGYWLYFLLRPLWLFLVIQFLMIGLLYLSNAFKIRYFAAPVLPADLQALPALLTETSGWRFLAMIAPLVALSLLFLAGLRWSWRTPVLLLAGVVPVAVVLGFWSDRVSQGLDSAFKYKAFAELENFEALGPTFYLVDEYAHARVLAGRIPSRMEVMAALQQRGLHGTLPVPSLTQPRDVYIFMMETFWDPSLLTSVHFSGDPLAPAFRALWKQSGESKVMVPVFGGGTPNSEFEVLCGIPAYDRGIVFVTTLHRPIECLPRILARLSYRTEAISPDEYGLWNRGTAFRLLGFERLYDADDLDETERNGAFMADAPLFDQVDALVAKESHPGPRLVYISTDSGHYPFDVDPVRRPPLIRSDSKDPLLNSYANAVRYDSAELADYIARIRARDPDAVILAFGDHLPVLGMGLQDYIRSGFISRQEQDVTAQMLEASQSTPLLLIDGRRGPLTLGHVSLFELPRLVLSLLGVKQPVLADAFMPPDSLHARPIGGRLLQVTEGGASFCSSGPILPGCADTLRWSDDMQVLRTDLLTGADYTESALYGSASPAGPDTGFSYLNPDREVRPCDIKVISWDPAEARAGHAFNKPLDSSDSAFLIKYEGTGYHVRMWLGFEELHVHYLRNNRIQASFTGSLPLYLVGEHDLTLACNGDPNRIKVGEFHIRLY